MAFCEMHRTGNWTWWVPLEFLDTAMTSALFLKLETSAQFFILSAPSLLKLKSGHPISCQTWFQNLSRIHPLFNLIPIVTAVFLIRFPSLLTSPVAISSTC